MNRIIEKLCDREDVAVINQNVSKVMKLDGKAVRIICGHEALQTIPVQEPNYQVLLEIISTEPDEKEKPTEKCCEAVKRLFFKDVADTH